MSHTSIIKDAGQTFLIRIVNKGDRFGSQLCLTHNEDTPLIEFYDHDFDFEYDGNQKLGQFISRYYISTLRSSEYSSPFTTKSKHGLALNADIPEWSITPAGMNKVMAFIETLDLQKRRSA